MGEGEKGKDIVSTADTLNKKMEPIEQQLTQVKLKSSEGMLRYPVMLNEQVYGVCSRQEDA